MATQIEYARQDSSDVVPRRLLVIWQDPGSRNFIRVGRLSLLTNESYRFEYLPGADHQGFEPLPSFPDLGGVYASTRLPAFFRNRVMSRQRGSYPEYAEWLGLDPAEDAPFEVLTRTGGERATDTFHIVEEPRVGPDGKAVVRFFASGIRYIKGSDRRLRGLHQEDRLTLRAEPSNPKNPSALLVDAVDDEPIGWVPDWLLDDIYDLAERSRSMDLRAERVNPSAPAHLRLLCRLEVHLKERATE